MKAFFTFRIRKCQKGQTSSEYVFLLAIMVVIGVGLFKRIRPLVLGQGECTPDSRALTCRLINRIRGPLYFEGGYRYFTIRQ